MCELHRDLDVKDARQDRSRGLRWPHAFDESTTVMNQCPTLSLQPTREIAGRIDGNASEDAKSC